MHSCLEDFFHSVLSWGTGSDLIAGLLEMGTFSRAKKTRDPLPGSWVPFLSSRSKQGSPGPGDTMRKFSGTIRLYEIHFPQGISKNGRHGFSQPSFHQFFT